MWSDRFVCTNELLLTMVTHFRQKHRTRDCWLLCKTFCAPPCKTIENYAQYNDFFDTLLLLLFINYY